MFAVTNESKMTSSSYASNGKYWGLQEHVGMGGAVYAHSGRGRGAAHQPPPPTRGCASCACRGVRVATGHSQEILVEDH